MPVYQEEDDIGFLEVEISNFEFIEIDDFHNILLSLSNIFDMNNRSKDLFAEKQTRLQIKAIREGSIVVELAAVAASYAQFAGYFVNITQFVGYFQSKVDKFKNGDASIVTDGKPECIAFQKMAEAISRNERTAARVRSLRYIDGEKKIGIEAQFDGQDARAINDTLSQVLGIENISNPTPAILEDDSLEFQDFHHEDLVFVQTSISPVKISKTSGEKAKISSLSEEEKAVIYASDNAAFRIRHEWQKPNQNPYNLVFNVSGMAEIKKGKIKNFKIFEVHNIREAS